MAATDSKDGQGADPRLTEVTPVAKAAPVRASAQALGTFATHLGVGVGGSAHRVRLTCVEHSDASLWYTFENDLEPPIQIHVAQVGEDRWYANGRTLKFGYRGASLSALGQTITKRMVERFDGTSFEKLAGFVLQNAESAGSPALRNHADQFKEAKAEPNPEEHSFKSWAHPDRWREFCGYPVLKGNPWDTFLGHLRYNTSVNELRHGDVECQDFSVGRLGSQWRLGRTEADSGGTTVQQVPYFTMVTDQDVVLGTGVRKLEGLLGELRDTPLDGGLHFYNCCIPMMTGDPVRGAVERFGAEKGISVIYSDMSSLTCSSQTIPARFEAAVHAVARRPVETKPGSFNLVGFPSCSGRRDMIKALNRIGASLNMTLVPELTLQGLETFGAASAQACLPNAYYGTQYALLAQFGVPTLSDLAPWGHLQTVLWLKALAALIGPEYSQRLDDELPTMTGLHQGRFEPLSCRAAGHRIALVLGPGDAELLGQPQWTAGLCVPRRLSELGFGVDVYAFGGKDGVQASEIETLQSLLRPETSFQVRWFADRAELDTLLGNGGASAVYSNVRRDKRLTQNGLLGIALEDFEMGLPGEIRTLERLLALCEIPFYRSFARHLRGKSCH